MLRSGTVSATNTSRVHDSFAPRSGATDSSLQSVEVLSSPCMLLPRFQTVCQLRMAESAEDLPLPDWQPKCLSGLWCDYEPWLLPCLPFRTLPVCPGVCSPFHAGRFRHSRPRGSTRLRHSGPPRLRYWARRTLRASDLRCRALAVAVTILSPRGLVVRTLALVPLPAVPLGPVLGCPPTIRTFVLRS